MPEPEGMRDIGGRVGGPEGFGGALVARVDRDLVVAVPGRGGSRLVRREGGREGGFDTAPAEVETVVVGSLSAVLEAASGRELLRVPIAGSFRG